MRKIIITGAAGLVGQNLVARLKNRSDIEIVGIDKHAANVEIFKQVHPGVKIVEADLAVAGDWSDQFAGADTVIINQAQIGGLFEGEFAANNVEATKHILAAVQAHNVSYFVGISSSVVSSIADDFYAKSKTEQEGLFAASKVPNIILRPTLMFGWFDRKHLGWLRRFMDRSMVFPIPGNGNFARQPLYVGDFSNIILSAVNSRKEGVFDISGQETITYGALIKTIHTVVKPKARLLNIPYSMFWALLWVYALFDKTPPFTTSQLEALVIPESFPVIDWPAEFGVPATPLVKALEETYLNPDYAPIVLDF